MLLASVVLLEGMRILDLTFTNVGHPLHRGRMASVESHKGAALASRLTIDSRSNLYERWSSASQRADGQCGEQQGSDPCLQVGNDQRLSAQQDFHMRLSHRVCECVCVCVCIEMHSFLREIF